MSFLTLTLTVLTPLHVNSLIVNFFMGFLLRGQ